jgi:hypothetical protein
MSKKHFYEATGGEQTAAPSPNDLMLWERASDHVVQYMKYSTLAGLGIGGGGSFNGGTITSALTITPSGGVNSNALLTNGVLRAQGGDASHASLVVSFDAVFNGKATFGDVSVFRQTTNTLRVNGSMKVDGELQADGFVGRYLTIGSVDTAPVVLGDAGGGEVFFTATGGEIFRTQDTSLWISQQLRFATFTPDRVVGWDIAGNIVQATTDMLPIGSVNKYFTNALAVGSVLTGLDLMIAPTSVAATDTILQAFAKLELRTLTNDAKVSFTNAGVDARITNTWRGLANGLASLDSGGKVPSSQLPSSITGQVSYIGTWNATTNTPTIPTAASGNKGWFYIVNVAGTTTINGISDWKVGDWIISDGSTWSKVDNTDAVSTVFGRQGAIVATSGDYNTSQVTESGSLYFTEARVRSSLLTGISTGTGGTVTGSDSVLSALGKHEFRTAVNDAKVGYTDTLVRACVLTGINTGAGGAISATDTVLTAFGKTQFRVNAIETGYLQKAGGTMTGNLTINSGAGVQPLIVMQNSVKTFEVDTNGAAITYGQDDNGDGYAAQWIDRISGRKRAIIRMVNDGDLAEHGRFTACGQNNDVDYINWNCGRFEAINLRSPIADKRLCIINMRGKNYDTDCSGRMDFFTRIGINDNVRNPGVGEFNVGMHINEYGRVWIGAGNGYPTPYDEVEPTAWLMLAPGNNLPLGAPLKFRSGQVLDIPEDGAMEFDGDHIYVTIASTRYKLDQQTGDGGRLTITKDNASADMQDIPSTALNIENPTSGQSMFAFTFNEITLGGLRMDTAGNLNYFGTTQHMWWKGIGTDYHIAALNTRGFYIGDVGGTDAFAPIHIAASEVPRGGFFHEGGELRNAVPTTAVYDGSGHYDLTVEGANFGFTYVKDTNDTSVSDGVTTWSVNSTFIAVSSALTMIGTPDAAVTAKMYYNRSGQFDFSSGVWTMVEGMTRRYVVQSPGNTVTSSAITIRINGTDRVVPVYGTTGAWQLPSGTTAEEPANAAGLIRWNTTTGRLEINIGASWKNFTRLDGDTMTGALLVQKDALATTTQIGLQAINTTAATVGNQQVSPALQFTGRGWKTDATAGSQSADIRIFNLPVQGTANPTGSLLFQFGVNGGAFSTFLTLTSGGNLTATGSITVASAGLIGWTSRTQLQSPSDGVATLLNNAGSDFTRLQFGGTTASFPSIKRSTTALVVRLADDSANGDLTAGVITGDRLVISSAAINAQTGTSYSLVAADNGKIITLSNASAITLTVPSGLGAGFTCTLIQIGAGQVTVTPSSTTVNSYGALTKLAGQHASAVLVAYVADTFNLAGALTA